MDNKRDKSFAILISYIWQGPVAICYTIFPIETAAAFRYIKECMNAPQAMCYVAKCCEQSNSSSWSCLMAEPTLKYLACCNRKFITSSIPY